MSFSVPGGFTGGDALLAFAAVQQGRWNEQMSEAMTMADLRSQMAQDLNDIKAHLEIANRLVDEHPEKFAELDAELQAFMTKYGSVPELDEITSEVGKIAGSVREKQAAADQANIDNGNGHGAAQAQWATRGGGAAPPAAPSTVVPSAFADETIRSWTDLITQKLDACGTSDDLNMIHIKQLNDRINNSSGMVSGIIESRNNSTASIINNIA
jgi:hypothetical protein